MLVGVAIVGVLVLGRHDPLLGLNAGFVALVLNFVIVAIVSLLTPAEHNPFEEPPQRPEVDNSFNNRTAASSHRPAVLGPNRATETS